MYIMNYLCGKNKFVERYVAQQFGQELPDLETNTNAEFPNTMNTGSTSQTQNYNLATDSLVSTAPPFTMTSPNPISLPATSLSENKGNAIARSIVDLNLVDPNSAIPKVGQQNVTTAFRLPSSTTTLLKTLPTTPGQLKSSSDHTPTTVSNAGKTLNCLLVKSAFPKLADTLEHQLNSKQGATLPTKSPGTAPALREPPLDANTPTMRLGGFIKNSALNSIPLPLADRLLSQIPLMNSMVRYQLQKLLKVREINRKKHPHSANLLKRPVAVLTAYSIRTVSSKRPAKSFQQKMHHKLSGKVFYGDFLPVTCEYMSAVIHLDKFYCPGTYRPCIEFEGTLISPFHLLQKVGLSCTVNWQAIFRVGDGQSVKLMFDNNELDFKDHDVFCSGQCPQHSSKRLRLSVSSILENLFR